MNCIFGRYKLDTSVCLIQVCFIGNKGSLGLIVLSSIFALPGLLVFLYVLGKSELHVKSIFILIIIILLLLGTVRSVTFMNGWKNPTRRYK